MATYPCSDRNNLFSDYGYSGTAGITSDVCLILFSVCQYPDWPLVLAANRDEYYDRPTIAADYWQEYPDILAGRDMEKGGSWLGVDRHGRLAAITNYRDPAEDNMLAQSRGELVINFLRQDCSAGEYLQQVQGERSHYNGFNLLVMDKTGFWCLASRTDEVRLLSAGLYGCSNDLLDTPWPKVIKGKGGLQRLLDSDRPVAVEDVFTLLSDHSAVTDETLPDTGVGIEWERILAPVFIRSSNYGTRSSTVVLINREGRLCFAERSFNRSGDVTGTVRYEFDVNL